MLNCRHFIFGRIGAAVLLAPALAACAAMQLNRGPELPPAPLPVYEVGDRFVYDDGSSVVVSVVWPQGAVTWKRARGQTRVAAANFVMPPLQWENGPTAGGFETSANPNALWPLSIDSRMEFAGRAYALDRRDGSQKSFHREYKCAVKGTKTLTVGAGTFDTFRIECSRRSRGSSGRTSKRIYRWFYAPAVGHYVLHEIKRRGRTLRREELVATRRAYGGLEEPLRSAIEQLRVAALSARHSGEREIWTDRSGRTSAAVLMLATFRTDDGAYCRRYLEIVRAGISVQKSPGVACKGDDGTWQRL